MNIKKKNHIRVVKNIIYGFIGVTLCLFVLQSSIVYADPTPPPPAQCGGQGQPACTNPPPGTPTGITVNAGIKNPLGSSITDLPTFIVAVLNFVFLIGIPIIAFAIIYAGFLFVTAQGNERKLTSAKQTLVFTLVGAALVLGSYVIANAIKSTVTCISSNSTTCS